MLVLSSQRMQLMLLCSVLLLSEAWHSSGIARRAPGSRSAAEFLRRGKHAAALPRKRTHRKPSKLEAEGTVRPEGQCVHFHPVLHVEHVSKGPSSHMKPERVFLRSFGPMQPRPQCASFCTLQDFGRTKDRECHRS